jgi:hypothetical protein
MRQWYFLFPGNIFFWKKERESVWFGIEESYKLPSKISPLMDQINTNMVQIFFVLMGMGTWSMFLFIDCKTGKMRQ